MPNLARSWVTPASVSRLPASEFRPPGEHEQFRGLDDLIFARVLDAQVLVCHDQPKTPTHPQVDLRAGTS